MERRKRSGSTSIKKSKYQAKIRETSKEKILVKRQLFCKKLTKYLSLTLTLKRANDYKTPPEVHFYTTHRQECTGDSRKIKEASSNKKCSQGEAVRYNKGEFVRRRDYKYQSIMRQVVRRR